MQANYNWKVHKAMTPAEACRRALEDAAFALCKSIKGQCSCEMDGGIIRPCISLLEWTKETIAARDASLLSSGYKVTPREPTDEQVVQMTVAEPCTYFPLSVCAEKRREQYRAAHDSFSWPPKDDDRPVMTDAKSHDMQTPKEE